MPERFSLIPAVYVLLRNDDKIFLIRRAHTGYRDGFYSLPSGHIDGNESAVYAAAREAKEEVGVEIAEQDLKMVHVMHRLAEEGDHERLDAADDRGECYLGKGIACRHLQQIGEERVGPVRGGKPLHDERDLLARHDRRRRGGDAQVCCRRNDDDVRFRAALAAAAGSERLQAQGRQRDRGTAHAFRKVDGQGRESRGATAERDLVREVRVRLARGVDGGDRDGV